MPGRDQRRQHQQLLLRPRLRVPARVQHVLLDVQDRQPLPEAGHLPQHQPTPICYGRTAFCTSSTRADRAVRSRCRRHVDRFDRFMGEQTLPEMQAALTAAGHTTQAAFVTSIINQIYAAFSANPYPYGSEFSLRQHRRRGGVHGRQGRTTTDGDGQGQRQDAHLPRQQPVWYYYADPVTAERRELVAVPVHRRAGRLRAWTTTCARIDDAGARRAALVRRQDRQHRRDQLGPDRRRAPANLGTVAWTYQGMKGNVYVNSFDPADQHAAQRLAPDERRGRPGPVRRACAS